MARVPKLLFLLPALPLFWLAAPPAAAAGDIANGHFSATDTKVHVYDLAGHVELVPGTGRSVQVDARFGGRDGSRLGVATLTKDGTALVVTFPSDHIRALAGAEHSSSTIELNSDGTFRDHGGSWLLGGRRARIDDHPGGIEAWADLRISVPAGQQLDVHLGVGHATVTNVDGALAVTCAASNVTVNGARGSLHVATGSGDIEAHDVDGEQAFATGSGDLRASHLTGPAIKVGTGSGDVSVDRVESPRLKAETGSGDVTLAGVTASDLVLGTGSGDVSITLARRVDRLKIETGSGGVRITAPPDLGASVRVETGSGGIESDFPLTGVRRERGELAGVIGDGHGTIDVATGSGSVTLVRHRATGS